MSVLQSVDLRLFRFVNQTLSTRAGDVLWPLVTDYFKPWPSRIALVLGWSWLAANGCRRDRIAAVTLLLLVGVIAGVDHTLSDLLWRRARPCATVSDVHLLSVCRSGSSFPSAHTTVAFAVTRVLRWCRPRWSSALFAWAAVVGLSRIAVGVHYPSDVIGGAVLGWAAAGLVVAIAARFERAGAPAGNTLGGPDDGRVA